jgi:endonuclease YncB( thermonuclease family)
MEVRVSRPSGAGAPAATQVEGRLGVFAQQNNAAAAGILLRSKSPSRDPCCARLCAAIRIWSRFLDNVPILFYHFPMQRKDSLRQRYCAPLPAAVLIGLSLATGVLSCAAVTAVGSMQAAGSEHAAAAEEPTASPAAGTGYPAEVMRVIDGDTFEARVRVWPGLEVVTKVRLQGIDAPELSARCAGEPARAAAARNRLVALLAEGDVAVRAIRLEKYGGRVLAAATTRMTPDVGAALLAAGVARPYDGKRRQGWCG